MSTPGQGQKLDDDTLRSEERWIAEKIGDINGRVQKLQGVIDMVEGHWQGIGAGAFNKVQTDINNHMNSLNKYLAYFLEGIEATRKASGTNEQDIAAAIRRGADVTGGGYGVGNTDSKLNQYSVPPSN